MTKAIEKEEAATQALKEASKKLKKAESNLADVTAGKDDLQRNFDFTAEKLANLEKEHKELQGKYGNGAEDLTMLEGQNAKYRDTIVKNEAIMT